MIIKTDEAVYANINGALSEATEALVSAHRVIGYAFDKLWGQTPVSSIRNSIEDVWNNVNNARTNVQTLQNSVQNAANLLSNAELSAAARFGVEVTTTLSGGVENNVNTVAMDLENNPVNTRSAVDFSQLTNPSLVISTEIPNIWDSEIRIEEQQSAEVEIWAKDIDYPFGYTGKVSLSQSCGSFSTSYNGKQIKSSSGGQSTTLKTNMTTPGGTDYEVGNTFGLESDGSVSSTLYLKYEEKNSIPVQAQATVHVDRRIVQTCEVISEEYEEFSVAAARKVQEYTGWTAEEGQRNTVIAAGMCIVATPVVVLSTASLATSGIIGSAAATITTGLTLAAGTVSDLFSGIGNFVHSI